MKSRAFEQFVATIIGTGFLAIGLHAITDKWTASVAIACAVAGYVVALLPD